MSLALTAAPTPKPAPIRHLYVHVPFCPSICPYCDFHVLTRKSGQVEAYLAQLEREAAHLAAQYADFLDPAQLETVYLGGGTPSFLRDAELEQLTDTIRRHFGWGTLENTLEVNPGTTNKARAQHWRSLGFDRASVGVQSLDDATLKFLGRQHDAEQARQALQHLIAAGFRVSGDLITAVAGQPLAQDIAELIDLGVGHISAYTLTIEAGTPFARQGVSVSEDDERLGFEQTALLLQQAGFERYEISNYALPNQASHHNSAYWQNRFYLGLGPSAAGHYPVSYSSSHNFSQDSLAERRTNPHLHDWLKHDFAADHASESEQISPEDYITDALFMGLRTRAGVDLAALSAASGLQVTERYAAALSKNLELGLLNQTGPLLQATPQGWWLLNKVLSDFVNEASASSS